MGEGWQTLLDGGTLNFIQKINYNCIVIGIKLQRIIQRIMTDNKKNQNQSSKTADFLKPAKQNVNKAGKIGKSHHEYFRVMNEQKQYVGYRSISGQELSQHKSKQSAWLSLNVYINYHPGGSIMLEGCGRECSNLFNEYHPWVNGKYLLDKYKIGFLTR